MRLRKIVMASGNIGKLKELSRLLAAIDVEVVSQSKLNVRDADETGTTFAENSLIKAQHAATATGLPAIADDSGLMVDALSGEPGVYSARYAGPDSSDDENIDKLLRAMLDVPSSARSAAFHCTATFVSPQLLTPLVATGQWQGSILTARKGSGGFGYDPIFLDPQSGLSAAELSPEQKNARSHRGDALRKLVSLLGNERQP